MIVRDKPNVWHLLFVLRGSIVPRIAGKVAAVVALSIGVVALQETGAMRITAIAALPFSLIGIALSIFAGFRNSACYDRWWEARKVWGQMIVDVRSLARQALVYAAHNDIAIARPATLRCIAFVHALRDRMRDQPLGEAALNRLAAPEQALLRTVRNPPNLILRSISTEIGVWLAQERIAPQIAAMMEERVVALSGALAASERIKTTPVPYAYSLLLHRTAILFCLLLPFGLAAAAGAWTPLVVGLVSYTFFGLDALGDELELPFGRGHNALPLDALALGVEISLLEHLGESALPADPSPVNYLLS